MKLEAGHKMYGTVTPLEQDLVRFYTDDGRCLFEVYAGKDGKSLEVRGIDTCKVGGALYGSAILIRPHVSNSVTIEAAPYPA